MSKTNRRSAAVKRGYRALLIPVISITLISSCSTPVMTDKPGTTFGVIKVGSPRVSSRERLLNERLARDTWLTAQRDAVDEKQFGFQGISDIRDMVGIIARVGVEADPLKVKKFRLQSETDIEKLKGAKQADDVKRQFLASARERILAKHASGELSTSDAKTQLEALETNSGGGTNNQGEGAGTSAGNTNEQLGVAQK